MTSPEGRGCAITLAFYWEVFGDKDAADYFYPINTLRNYAALMVGAPHLRAGPSWWVQLFIG